MNQLRDVLQARVSNDPVTAALSDVVAAAVGDALHSRLPRLAFTRQEVAQMLGCDPSTVTSMIESGRLRTILDGPRSKVPIGALLDLVGWPMAPAPVAAPLTVVPETHRPGQGSAS